MPSPRRLTLAGAIALLLVTTVAPLARAADAPGWTQETVTFTGFTPAFLAGPELRAARDGRLVGVGVRATADLSSGGISIFERGPGAGDSWRIVANTHNSDVEPSLAVARGGTINVAWRREGSGLRFTSNRTGRWVVESIPSSTAAAAPSLALTSGGSPSIAWANALSRTTNAIRIASKTVSGWQVRTIASGAVGSPALAIDQWSKRYVAFVRTAGSAPGLYLATDRSGTWTTTRISSQTGIGSVRIALDLARHVHVAYTREAGATSIVRHATNASGRWVVSTVSGPGGGRSPELAIDSAGRPRVAFAAAPTYGSSTATLARWTATGWTREPISTDLVDGRPGLAIDAHGADHALLFRITDGFMGGEFIHATTAP